MQKRPAIFLHTRAEAKSTESENTGVFEAFSMKSLWKGCGFFLMCPKKQRPGRFDLAKGRSFARNGVTSITECMGKLHVIFAWSVTSRTEEKGLPLSFSGFQLDSCP